MLRKITVAVTLALMLITSLFALTGNSYSGNVPIGIYVNEREIATDTNPFIKNGTTFVPIRAISNALGITDIEWNDSLRTATIKGEKYVQFTIDEKYAFVDGKKHSLNEPAVIKNGRTMIPLRFLAEAIGADVSWDKVLHCVVIDKEGHTVPQENIASKYTKDDLLWLARIIEAESSGEPMEGQIAVGNVILNRVKNKDYPNTIYGVIFDRKHGVQFQPVLNGTVYNTPSKMCVTAAKRALMGENYVGECLFFLNEAIAENTWIIENRDFFATINNHSFYI